MGLLDSLGWGDDNSWGSNATLNSDDEDYSWFNSSDDSGEKWNTDDNGFNLTSLMSSESELDNSDTYDTQWDWMSGKDNKDFFTEFDAISNIDPSEDDDGLLSKVPEGVWSKLLNFGLGSLGEWLKQKNTTPTKKSGGGSSGPPPPVNAVKKATAIGTRTKG